MQQALVVIIVELREMQQALVVIVLELREMTRFYGELAFSVLRIGRRLVQMVR